MTQGEAAMLEAAAPPEAKVALAAMPRTFP
jgi:hypothetical protein